MFSALRETKVPPFGCGSHIEQSAKRRTASARSTSLLSRGIPPGNKMSGKKLLIVTDDAGESYEILYAKHRFMEAGYEPIVAATQKKLLNAVIHDFYPGWNTY